MAVDYDIVIIGGGSGGLVVASAAAQLNAKVALVEKSRLGGDCLWFGCVPSKSLLHASRVAHEVKHSSRFGIYTTPPDIQFSEATGHVQNVISTIQPHDSPERFESLGVEVIFGEGQFKDQKTFTVNGRDLKARAFVVSTGSRPQVPPIEGIEEAGFLTNEQIFSLKERPQSLAVIGAGPIGCELGQAMHRLGSQVTIVSSREQILPKEDPEAALVVEKQLEADGVNILRGKRAKKVEVIDGKKHLWVGKEKIVVDEILVSSGRVPNVHSLNLEAAGVEYTEKGIVVNQKLQTTNKRIYGCGDVIGGYQFTHVAGYEAAVVVQNALFFPSAKADYRVIPWATFTEPELARVGLSEKQARDRYGDKIEVLKQEFADVDRAQAERATEGFAKIITTSKGEILGAHLVGPSAGELIHEIILAMKNKLPVSALTGIIHIYPTLSEVNSKAALQLKKRNYAKNQGLQNALRKLFGLLRSIT
ncbi:dihydrolipoyl dehydrogenase family protein [Dactylococcopsis salina]|uniref:Pyruvate/2-oxoglutarate dehydrogenase complex, dihydrolipoamide dehydrogenase component n=1 Tax=Dactylococcopsis salina (strain PCC 8305) TaxID=13035 RepID=K9YX39_DACS8|nr:FAD-dependent oxidoreductase [Dactylococcopsis salina]AFZ50668.1 pyruvate/2-oxoglutarate dehydrogenase complex, dihydrolipoamide dehydrogenase component [Dactylococcopsis salina PCC 8305]